MINQCNLRLNGRPYSRRWVIQGLRTPILLLVQAVSALDFQDRILQGLQDLHTIRSTPESIVVRAENFLPRRLVGNFDISDGVARMGGIWCFDMDISRVHYGNNDRLCGREQRLVDASGYSDRDDTPKALIT